MLLPKRSRSTGQTRAQALVEFTLTAMLLLMMLMLIIEVARIFQAYVTLQGAARLAPAAGGTRRNSAPEGPKRKACPPLDEGPGGLPAR